MKTWWTKRIKEQKKFRKRGWKGEDKVRKAKQTNFNATKQRRGRGAPAPAPLYSCPMDEFKYEQSLAKKQKISFYILQYLSETCAQLQ